jgi:hypothetical protein
MLTLLFLFILIISIFVLSVDVSYELELSETLQLDMDLIINLGLIIVFAFISIWVLKWLFEPHKLTKEGKAIIMLIICIEFLLKWMLLIAIGFVVRFNILNFFNINYFYLDFLLVGIPAIIHESILSFIKICLPYKFINMTAYKDILNIFTFFKNSHKMHAGLGDSSHLKTSSGKKNSITEINPITFIMSDNDNGNTSPGDSSTIGNNNTTTGVNSSTNNDNNPATVNPADLQWPPRFNSLPTNSSPSPAPSPSNANTLNDDKISEVAKGKRKATDNMNDNMSEVARGKRIATDSSHDNMLEPSTKKGLNSNDPVIIPDDPESQSSRRGGPDSNIMAGGNARPPFDFDDPLNQAERGYKPDGKNQPLAGNMAIVLEEYYYAWSTNSKISLGAFKEKDMAFFYDVIKYNDRNIYEKGLDKDGIPKLNKYRNTGKLRELFRKTR